MSTPAEKDLLSKHSVRSMTQAGSEITKITEEADFCITTALLWLRTHTEKHDLDQDVNDDRAAGEKIPGLVDTNLDDLGLLDYHGDRLVASADALGWRSIQQLHEHDQITAMLRDEIQKHMAGLPAITRGMREERKVRVLMSKEGNLKIESSAINREPENQAIPAFMPQTLDFDHGTVANDRPVCNVVLDVEATRPSTFTTHKTNHRRVYDTARHRMNLEPYVPTKDEVLLYNPNGEVMEGCSSTVYFKRNGEWITPAAICGPNVGVTRRLALEHNLCKQGTLELQDVKDGEYVWLSNAVRGFFIGKINIEGRSKSHPQPGSR